MGRCLSLTSKINNVLFTNFLVVPKPMASRARLPRVTLANLSPAKGSQHSVSLLKYPLLR